jgi:hypothetical protein
MTKVLVAQAQKETALIGFAQASKQNVTQFMAVIQKAAMDNETKRFLAGLDVKQNLHSEMADTARTAAKLKVGSLDKAAQRMHTANLAAMQPPAPTPTPNAQPTPGEPDGDGSTEP